MTKRVSDFGRRAGIGLCIAAALGISALAHDVKYNRSPPNYASEHTQRYMYEKDTQRLHQEKSRVKELKERLQQLNPRGYKA